jgi:CubicO group peptidase (beta-lactamase class C family)
LKLVEQGKISFDTPISDYLPEFRNPIIVDRTSTQKTKFTPAKTVVTLKHVLNFSSGLFYPVVREDLHGFSDGYSSKEMHTTQDPTSAFFRIVIVRTFILPQSAVSLAFPSF